MDTDRHRFCDYSCNGWPVLLLKKVYEGSQNEADCAGKVAVRWRQAAGRAAGWGLPRSCWHPALRISVRKNPLPKVGQRDLLDS